MSALQTWVQQLATQHHFWRHGETPSETFLIGAQAVIEWRGNASLVLLMFLFSVTRKLTAQPSNWGSKTIGRFVTKSVECNNE
jgi:hypothetical protein